jgi:hypothetical protein
METTLEAKKAEALKKLEEKFLNGQGDWVAANLPATYFRDEVNAILGETLKVSSVR